MPPVFAPLLTPLLRPLTLVMCLYSTRISESAPVRALATNQPKLCWMGKTIVNHLKSHGLDSVELVDISGTALGLLGLQLGLSSLQRRLHIRQQPRDPRVPCHRTPSSSPLQLEFKEGEGGRRMTAGADLVGAALLSWQRRAPRRAVPAQVTPFPSCIPRSTRNLNSHPCRNLPPTPFSQHSLQSLSRILSLFYPQSRQHAE